MAVYPLHALTGILGPARRVMALAGRTRSSFVPLDGPAAGREVPVEVPDNWHLLVEHEGGALSSVEANNCAAGAAAPELELRGEAGVVAVSLLDMTEPVRVLEPGGVWRSEPPDQPRPAGPDHLLGVEELVDCVASGRSPAPSVDHALHVIEVFQAAARSAAEGTAVEVRSSFPGWAAAGAAPAD
jgi:predicted dehydrogenase